MSHNLCECSLFRGSCLHHLSLPPKKATSTRKITTPVEPGAVNVPHQVLLFLQAFTAWTAEALDISKSSSTSSSCAPHWFQWQDPFLSMCRVEGKQELHYFDCQWNIKMTTLVGCSIGVWFSGHQLLRLVYAEQGKEQHWKAACHFGVTKLKSTYHYKCSLTASLHLETMTSCFKHGLLKSIFRNGQNIIQYFKKDY